MQSGGPPIHFVNVEYFFRLLYDLIFGTHTVALGINGSGESFIALIGQIWLIATILAYIACVLASWVLIYYTLRFWQLTSEDDERYTTIAEAEEFSQVEHSRWAYITQLIESTQQSDWRQAIIEADIMLGEVLTQNGYIGDTIGEQLKTANPARFTTLQNAWDAHLVRNNIAHQGSAFQLSDHVAYRTIANYEAVFKEFKEI
jgi:hypothetical protein